MSAVFSLECAKQLRCYLGLGPEAEVAWLPLGGAFMGYHDSNEDCKELISLVDPFLQANPSKVDEYLKEPTYQDYGLYGPWSAFSIPDNDEPNVFWLYTIIQVSE